MVTFGELFKRYRLKACFASISDFADAFAEKGYVYDVTLYSHWQNGTRIPTRRILVIALIELFVERNSICSLHEANEFLESAGHGYLTRREQINFQTFL
jgi:hypothetical protein